MPAPKRPRKSAIESEIAIPSILSDEARQAQDDRLVLQMLGGLEQEEIRLDRLQRVNGHDETDLVPEEHLSYLQRREQIAANRKRIAATCDQDQLDRVAEMAKKL